MIVICVWLNITKIYYILSCTYFAIRNSLFTINAILFFVLVGVWNLWFTYAIVINFYPPLGLITHTTSTKRIFDKFWWRTFCASRIRALKASRHNRATFLTLIFDLIKSVSLLTFNAQSVWAPLAPFGFICTRFALSFE